MRVRADAGAGAGAAGDRVRRGHERIRAVIDVEQRALRAFEEDRTAVRERRVEEQRGVGDVRLEALPRRPGTRRSTSSASSVAEVVELRAGGSSRRARRSTFVRRILLVGEVPHADADARDLVHVGGADAAPRGADLVARRAGARAQPSRSRWYGMIRCALLADAQAVDVAMPSASQLVDLAEAGRAGR